MVTDRENRSLPPFEQSRRCSIETSDWILSRIAFHVFSLRTPRLPSPLLPILVVLNFSMPVVVRSGREIVEVAEVREPKVEKGV